jgi:hypothetical protein
MDFKKHYYDLKGKKAEQIVYELAEKTFMIDWCFKNPKLSSSKKELCDLIVVFGDTAIIWTVANIAFKGDVKRFTRKSIEHNLKQIKGAYTKLTRLKDTINLSNPVRGEEKFDPNLIKKIFMVAVCVGAGKIPFWGGEVHKGKLIHILDEISLTIILNELDTIIDFCHYIGSKEKFLLNTNQQVFIDGGEENLLAYYLYHGREFKFSNSSDIILIPNNNWDKLVSNPQYQAKNKENLISYGWDIIISWLHESRSPEYETMSRELANTSRLERRILAKSLMECKEEAKEKSLSQMKRFFTLNDKTYVYLIVEHHIDREFRKRMLGLTCFVARGLCKKNQRVIGIASDRAGSPAYAYDCCILEEPNWTAEDEKFKAKIQAEYGIFKDARYTPWSIDEYPKTQCNWDYVRLDSLFDVETGTTPSTKKIEYWRNGTINWFTPTDLSKLTNEIYIRESNRKITKEALKDTRLSLMPENSIIISTRAPVGYVAILAKKATFNQGCKGFVPKDFDSITPEFYCYFLQDRKYNLEMLSGGSTFKELSKQQIENFEVPLPPLPEQHKIAEILSTVDEAIEKVDEAIEKTERLKNGLMQELLTKGIGHKEFKDY